MKKIVAAAALAIASVSTADAAVFDFSYTTFEGTIAQGKVTATDLGGFYIVDDVTGTRNGVAITGYDFGDPTPQSFNYALGQASNVDFSYYIGTDNYEIRFPTGYEIGSEILLGAPGGGNDISQTILKFSLTPAAAAVPEPATWALMIVGFGGIGFGVRRRSKVAMRVSYAA